MTPVSPSSPAASVPSWAQRLVEQLQLMSEVSEALTYRLLELEERLAEGERELAGLRDHAHGGAELPGAMESWLEEADTRLARVEELLRGGEGRGSSRSLQAVATPTLRRIDPEPEPELEQPAYDPFPEEEEQVFLDEQSA